MARPRKINGESVLKAQTALKEARTLEQFRCAQAVLLPAMSGCTLEQTATLLGVGRATVPRLQARFHSGLQHKSVQARRWGGRRRALMGLEQERAFLDSYLEQASSGQMLVVSPLREALAKLLGRPVAASVVYRMLARHDWRKMAPDTRHPKSDLQVQDAWKKNCRKCWRPP